MDFTWIVDELERIDNLTRLCIAAILIGLLLAFWIGYYLVKGAVRNGIKEAGFIVMRSAPSLPVLEPLSERRKKDPAYDFVYTEPGPD